jgi:TetR/AcrR family transcriptional regulator, transcriptional repressor for nem operon
MSRPRRQEMRLHILQRAQALFYERGFRGVSMEDVAAAAGIKKANLFYYFPTREALQLAVIDAASDEMRTEVRAWLAAARQPIRAVARMFDEARGWMRRRGCRGGCFVGNLAQELSDQDERARRKVADQLAFWQEQLAVLLERSRTTGFFRKELDAEGAAAAILALFEGSLLCSKAYKKTEAIVSARRMAVGYLEAFRA